MRSKKKQKKTVPSVVGSSKNLSLFAIPASAIIIIVAGFLAYANSFQVPFLFDDLPNILDNPTIRNLKNIGQVFHPPVGSGVGDRPVVNFTLAINYAISGEKVWSYHFLNVLIHVIAALALFGIVRRTLVSERMKEAYGHMATPLALGSALIWLLHPIQTQAVTYIIQRCESLMGMFFLLTSYCAIRSWSSPSATAWRILALASFILGAGSKEVIVVAPFVVLAYEWIFVRPSLKEVLKHSWPLYAGYGIGIVLLIILVVSGGTLGTGLSKTLSEPWQYWQTQPQVILHYLHLVFWPNSLCFDYGWPLLSFRDALPALLFLLLMLAGSSWLFVRRSPLGFLAFCFFAILAPTSIMLLRDPAVEYRVYLPLVALAVAAVIGIYELANVLHKRFGLVKEGQRKPILFTALLILCVIAGSLTSARNRVYQQDLTLWEDTVQKRPQNAKAHLNLGMALFNAGKTDVALTHFQETIRLKPDNPDAYSNMGGALLKMQRPEEALVYFQKGLTLRPDVKTAAWFHSNMGVALFGLGRKKEALEHFREAIRLRPDQAECYANLGLVRERMNQLPEAIEAWERALEINPDLKGVQERLTAVKQKKRAGKRPAL